MTSLSYQFFKGPAGSITIGSRLSQSLDGSIHCQSSHWFRRGTSLDIEPGSRWMPLRCHVRFLLGGLFRRTYLSLVHLLHLFSSHPSLHIPLERVWRCLVLLQVLRGCRLHACSSESLLIRSAVLGKKPGVAICLKMLQTQERFEQQAGDMLVLCLSEIMNSSGPRPSYSCFQFYSLEYFTCVKLSQLILDTYKNNSLMHVDYLAKNSPWGPKWRETCPLGSWSAFGAKRSFLVGKHMSWNIIHILLWKCWETFFVDGEITETNMSHTCLTYCWWWTSDRLQHWTMVCRYVVI